MACKQAVLVLLACGVLSAGAVPSEPAHIQLPGPDLLRPTYSGYLDVDRSAESAIFYTYFESQKATPNSELPILLWLQGGPGCASQFGNLYELGPQRVQPDLRLKQNIGAWNFEAGLLFLDQPIGVGFSLAGDEGIPTDEMEMAADLYAALQQFFSRYKEFQARPFFITGESYAGKYVPSIGHYILQVSNLTGHSRPLLEHSRSLPRRLSTTKAPHFNLSGLAIGNGLVDPKTQVLATADVAYYAGLLDHTQRLAALQLQLNVSQLIQAREWAAASRQRDELLQYITNASGVGTLLDYTRQVNYDAADTVSQYLNQLPVKAELGALKSIKFVACSPEVDAALSPDMMKSVVHLVPDILKNIPVLIYEGVSDGQDGPATAEAWLKDLQWNGTAAFTGSARHLWRPDLSQLQTPPQEAEPQTRHVQERPDIAGYVKHYEHLTQVTVRGAGHMVPHDQPLRARAMIETWVGGVVFNASHWQT